MLLAAIMGTIVAGSGISVGDSSPSTQPVEKTGAFEITFSQRSPLSERSKLMDRLAEKDIGPEFDLNKQPFAIYVPSDFGQNKPLGLVVYMSNQAAAQTPPTLQPILEKRRLIFIVAEKPNLSLGEETGLSIDAVYNLKRRYPINDRRTFLIGAGWAENAALATPDIFAGDVWIWNTGYWRNVPINRNQYYKGIGHAPSPEMLTLAKRRPHVFGFETDNYNDGIRSLLPGAMTHDGFEHMLTAVIAADDVSYPNLKPQWFEKMLDMLEPISLAEAKAATRASSTTNAAQSLLNLAQAYINAGKVDIARQKLETLLQEYPSDPAADKAKALLQQLQGQ
ncbi:MAG: hypothetical protein ABSB74_20305 [Tepidisphaeraceae bacterium]